MINKNNNTKHKRRFDSGRYYHQEIENLCKFIIPKGSKVLEIGSGEGNLLASVKPSYGVGIDISKDTIRLAKSKHKLQKFILGNAERLKLKAKFDYVILSDLIGELDDIQKTFLELHKVTTNKTRLVITYYNFLWEPLLNLAERLGLKNQYRLQNWLSAQDIENLLFLSDFEIVKKGTLLLLPINIPVISKFINKYISKIPLLKNLNLVSYFVAREKPTTPVKDCTVSIVVPARNEEGNIEKLVSITPKIGKSTEIIFVEGGSKDNTLEKIKKIISENRSVNKLKLIEQGKGVGKGDAVRKGFAKSKGDILMILDADLSVSPKDLYKFYDALKSGRAEFVMGSRLVYQPEAQAMRVLNILGNKFFSLMFSWLLDQPIKDTLCGTKVLFKKDYLEIEKNRKYFGDFDPFGDFDLIFGASKLNLRIAEIPVRYKARTYGTTNISRFKHGWLLLKMTIYAARKIKFI